MKIFCDCFLFLLVGMVSGQICPNMFPSIYTVQQYSYNSNSSSNNFSMKLQIPLSVQSVEIVTLTNKGGPKDTIKLDSTVFTDPTQTKLYPSSAYSNGYYLVDLTHFPDVSPSEYLIVCINTNVVHNEKVMPCRMCKLVTLTCFSCSFQFISYQIRTFGDGTGQVEAAVMNLPVPMTLECAVKGMATPSYNGNGPYYTQSPSSSLCPADGDTFTTPKSKLSANSIVVVPFEKLKANYQYEIQAKFEIHLNGNSPFDWPKPLPLMTEPYATRTFTVGNVCSTKQ